MNKSDFHHLMTSKSWHQADGKPISCKEKLKILDENYGELQQMMQDAFEDALIIGVDEDFFRTILKEMVDQLRSPME